MSNPNPRQAALQQQQSQRLKAFRTLLDPTDLLPGHNVADLYSLRHLCLQGGGIPDTASSSSHGWLRAQAWRVLLGYLSPEKSEWNSTLEKRRAEYYQFAQDLLPQHASSSKNTLPGNMSERDTLLDQIYRDLSRSRKNAFAFYREEIKPSRSCPLAPAPAGEKGAKERIGGRHSFLQRLEMINDDFAYAMREERKSASSSPAAVFSTPKKSRETLLPVTSPNGEHQTSLSPSITLEPASPGSNMITPPGGSGASDGGDSYFASADEGEASAHSEASTYIDRRWHSLLRILYIYALLNPSIGYVQGMNEVLFVLLYVMGTSGPLPSATGPPVPAKEGQAEEELATSFQYLEREESETGTHAEADAFWCFSALVGDIRGLYDFEGMESAGLQITNARSMEGHASNVTGMAAALKRFSLRLKWLDERLWKQMRMHSLDPRLPYYSFRWLACIVSTELTLPSVLRIWDAILSESAAPSGAEASPKVDFLIDICCSLLISVRESILASLDGIGGDESLSDSEAPDQDSFGRAMKVLQSLPDDDVEPTVEMACLYRQRRLAAPLTGDAPASDDEDESLLSVRDRAANAFRTWTNARAASSAATPTRKPKWLISSPRTPSTAASPGGEEGTRSSSAALLKRYTEAMQSSDAAASLSKASTNFTAKAMATWSGSRGRSSSSPFARERQEASPSPFSDLKASFVNRVMSATSSSSPVSDDAGSVHPSLRWSVQGAPPDLPVPDVNDSPPGRADTTFHATTPARGFASVNRLGSMSLAMQQSADSPLSPEMGGYADSTPGTSPVSASISKFGATPIMQTTPRTQARGAGPKPLLLTGSARPPRERSPSGSVAGDDVSSRKVSSGPLAANVHSPQQMGFHRRRRKASYRGGDSSYAGSGTSSAAGADSTSNETTEEDTLASTDAAVPLLPSLQAAKLASPMVPPKTGGGAGGTPPLGLLGSGQGTVPASAFSKVRAASYGTGDGASAAATPEEEKDGGKKLTSRPAFGQVASSADVPLSTKVTLQRKPKRTSSGQIVLVSGEEEHPQQHMTNGASRGSQLSRRSGSYTAAEKARGDTPAEARDEPRRYTLTDEPATVSSPPLGGNSHSSTAVERRESNSSTRSSAGIVRSRRAYSGAKRGSSSRQSLSHLPESSAVVVDSQSEERDPTLTSRGGSESLRLGTIETGENFALDFFSSKDLRTSENDQHHQMTPPPAVMTPHLPSPGGVLDNGKVLGADELLDRLQLDQGYSGGESSGFEEDVVHMPPARRPVIIGERSSSKVRQVDGFI